MGNTSQGLQKQVGCEEWLKDSTLIMTAWIYIEFPEHKVVQTSDSLQELSYI